jgi:hypothetical protein
MAPRNTVIANNATRQIFRSLVYWPLMKNMMRRNFDTTFHINCSNHAVGNDMLDLVTVACNNDYTIEQQARLLNKYLTDSFCYMVADNSTIPLKQQKILDICRKSNIAYIRLPSNPLTTTWLDGYSHGMALSRVYYSHIKPRVALFFGFGCYSHGMALNWVYYNYIKPRAAPYFGFLDHDIYPVKMTSIKNVLKRQPIFGDRHFDASVWYLYPGFCFFRRDSVLGKALDFTPNKGRNTGFSNWGPIYSEIDPVTIEFPSVSSHKLRDSENSQLSTYVMIGDWIHTYNASYSIKELPKEDSIEKLLGQF